MSLNVLDGSVPDALLKALTGPATIPLGITAEQLAAAEAVDVEIGDRHEHIDIGPFDGAYVRVCTEDLLVWVDEARRLLDRVTDSLLDARQAEMEKDRHRCYCGTKLEADEMTCRAPRCERAYAQDLSL